MKDLTHARDGRRGGAATSHQRSLAETRDRARQCIEEGRAPVGAREGAVDANVSGLIWRGLSGLGLTRLCEEAGRDGLSNSVVVAEELGRAACPSPILGAVVASVILRHHAGNGSGFVDRLTDILDRGAGVGIGFGSADGDPYAGSVHFEGGVLNGSLSFVETSSDVADLLIAGQTTLGLVRCSDMGVSQKPASDFLRNTSSKVVLRDVRAETIPVAADRIHDLNRLARLVLVARSLGAAQRAFDLVVNFAKVRRQFKQPIGAFQAIQHKLANCLVSLEGVRRSLYNAARAYDLEQDEWRLFASACFAFASPALRQVSLETQHVFGAVGYSEDHEAPAHFRRVHSDMLRFGGVRRAREEVARYLLEGAGTLPDHDYGPRGRAFREEVRTWLAGHWTAERRAEFKERDFESRVFDRALQRELGEKGWIGIAWPKAFGGQERTPVEQIIYLEELEKAEAPVLGASLQATAIINFGTPAQQQRYLPGVRSGEIVFCTGYTELEAGSDLMALQTTAIRDGDGWIINGRKSWNLAAPYADFIWLAAKTEADAASGRAGISMFIVPVDAAGVTIAKRPAMHGRALGEIFLEDVRLSGEALVGEVNGGWKILTSTLAEERMLIGSTINQAKRLLEGMVAFVRAADGTVLRNDRAVQDQIGALAADVEVGRCLLMHCVRIAERGEAHMVEAATSKYYSSNLLEQFGEKALDILGLRGALSEDAEDHAISGELEQFLRQAIMFVLGGGTAEMQLNMIARQGLGLPRS